MMSYRQKRSGRMVPRGVRRLAWLAAESRAAAMRRGWRPSEALEAAAFAGAATAPLLALHAGGRRES